MKKIKRTIIKIRKRELVVARSGAGLAPVCPFCNFPALNPGCSTAELKAAVELFAKSIDEQKQF